MKPIEPPVRPGESGPRVANLQDLLGLLLERGVIRGLNASAARSGCVPLPSRRTQSAREDLVKLGQGLARERAEAYYGDATQRLVQIVQIEQGLGDRLHGVVDDRTAEVLNRLRGESGTEPATDRWLVKGRVTRPGGGAARNLVVRAHDRDLRTSRQLGRDARTDADGRYRIEYSPEEFQQADIAGPDVVVRALAGDRQLAESPTFFNASKIVEIDLELADRQDSPEFARHMDALTPPLANQAGDGTDLAVADLTDEDLAFLAGDTGIEPAHLALLRAAFVAARAATETVPAELLYGWMREGQPDTWDAVRAQSPTLLRTATLAAVEHDVIDPDFAARVDAILEDLPNELRDGLGGSGLDPKTLGAILSVAGRTEELSDSLVTRLVDDGALSELEAHRVGLVRAAHVLADGDTPVIEALLQAQSTALGDRGLRRARDLAALDEAEIERALRAADGADPGAQAAELAERIADLFPSDALLCRATRAPDGLAEAVANVIEHPHQSDPRFEAFSNVHAGLRLREAIEDAPDATTAEKLIMERVGWVDLVRESNPEVDLLEVDYLPDSEGLAELDFAGLAKDAQVMVVDSLKTYQRVRSLGVGAAGALDLLQAGYTSATAITRSTPGEIVVKTGLSFEKVRGYYEEAERQADEAALAFIAVHNLERDHLWFTAQAMPVPPSAYLKRLGGYDQLFGNATFCDCEHCESVLGAAAYFVDLMAYVERNILKTSFSGQGGEQNSLHLRKRREDLWTKLELTCDNANRIVPTLDLVIELLETFIADQKDFASRDVVYQQLVASDDSIRLPFSLPLERLTAWLSHLDLRRHEIASVFLPDPAAAPVRARVRLGLFAKQFELITTSRLGDRSVAALAAAEPFFERWLRVGLTLPTVSGEVETKVLDPLGSLELGRACGLDREALGAVIATRFVNGTAAGAPAAVTFEAGLSNPGGVQNDIERILNFTAARLDRCERFVRLRRHVPWTTDELDYVLERLAGADVDAAQITALAQLREVQDRLGVSVAVLCALWDAVPTRALAAEAALFERTFNHPPFARIDPAAVGTIAITPDMRARLVAALRISDQDLAILQLGLAACLGATGVDVQANTTFTDGLRFLSVMYRHARLAQALKLSVADLLRTIALAPSVTGKPAASRCVFTLDDLLAVLAAHDWRLASGFSLAEIESVTTNGTPAGLGSPTTLAAEIAAEVAGERALEISGDLFTPLGFTPAEGLAVIADNLQAPAGAGASLLEQVPGADAYRINRAIKLGDIAGSLVFVPDPQSTAALVAAIARDLYRLIARGAEPAALTTLGMTAAEATAYVQANLSAVPGDGKPLEAVAGSQAVRWRPGVSEADVVAGFGAPAEDLAVVAGVLKSRAREAIMRQRIDVARDIYRIIRRAGAAGFTASALTELGLSLAEATTFAEANVSGGADAKPLERIQAGPPAVYRRRAAVLEADAIAAFGSDADFQAVKSILRGRAIDLLRRRHPEAVLAAKASVAVRLSPEKTAGLLALAVPDADRTALIESLQGGPTAMLETVLARLMRAAVLFRDPAYDPQALAFVRANAAVFALATPATAETVRRVALYATLAQAPDAAYEPDARAGDASARHTVLAWATRIAGAAGDAARGEQLARALRCDARDIQDALAAVGWAAGDAVPRLDELAQLQRAIALVRRLGIPAGVLRLCVSEAHADLSRGADGIYAAIRAKYEEENDFRAKIEPFEDTVRSRTRDGLVEYLMHAPDDATTDWRRRFLTANDLYHHFLTDVMVEGCARTSKIVFAISSVQLYVHRVIMHLEQSDEEPPAVVAAFAESELQDEWQWRRNYQVWVANRKVFLFPENYVEPGLRDDKTPLFRELEDTLLQQQITEQNVLDAYSRYLHGFEELARLRIAGAYHDRDGTAGDLLHLFGVTPSDPPVYYYRTVRDLDNAAGPVFSAWEKVDLQILAREVSPVVYLGRLYVFWVETTTRPVTDFASGSSTFKGYRHTVRMKYSQLRLDGKWSPPQVLRVTDTTGTSEARLIEDTSQARKRNDPWWPGRLVPWDAHNRDHTEVIETYTPDGWEWERPFLDVATPPGAGQRPQLRLLFFPRSNVGKPWMELVDLPGAVSRVDANAYAESYVRGFQRIRQIATKQLVPSLTWFDNAAVTGPGSARATWTWEEQWPPVGYSAVIEFPGTADIEIVAGGDGSALVHVGGEPSLLHPSGTGYVYRRLTTSLAPELAATAATDGIPGLLATAFQIELTESASRATALDPKVTSLWPPEPTSKHNPFLPYFREALFQVPFLIADHLNSEQRFADAQRWYHFLFDPTASETDVDEKTRPWRYREFRELPIQTLREALTDRNALAAYRADPFNPHAIARLRPGAYQKSIFMKYIDNLLDWGDSLFSQFTMESVNEATMLYVMAADILGPRPAELGSCGEMGGAGRTYSSIARLLGPMDAETRPTTDFLIEQFETFTIEFAGQSASTYGLDRVAANRSKKRATNRAFAAAAPAAAAPAGATSGLADPAHWNYAAPPTWTETSSTSFSAMSTGRSLGENAGPAKEAVVDTRPVLRVDNAGPHAAPKGLKRGGRVTESLTKPAASKKHHTKRPPKPKAIDLVHARLIFCIPGNAELRGYWDRVEDRLNKIRNCMDISGVRRRLELFAPEIDPRMLVRMRAAGVSLDDVMNVVSGTLPPYRFAYLIEKAKQHTSLVQNFGSQVLTAIEKRDGEELTRLKTVHEQNLLKLHAQSIQWEIDAAEDTLESLRRQQVTTTYRREHYAALADAGLTAWERTQQVSTHLVSSLHEIEGLVQLVRAGLSLLPQLGAPTAMKYGGMETAGAAAGFASASQALAQAAAGASASSGLEATFQRRGEDWNHQAESARLELEQIAKQLAAAEIRRDIAIETQKSHQRSIEQSQEVYDFLRDRFTDFGRYSWLSAELQKLHRTAFNGALSLARLAEQACHFERPDEATQPRLSGDYWDAGNAGLLAGDRLLLDLHNLEREYLETSNRTLEIEQSFSLARFDPDALSLLKTDCACTFEIPEWFFDLTYAGHYRRRIKAVRLTLPCVVGPHTSVGATLRLTGSHIRSQPRLDSRAPVPLRQVTAIAASTGQSDAGVFDFSFRDERYLPFEGAGASSRWQLSLPKAVRPFDYATISDVILRISYTAEHDGGLEQLVEGANGTLRVLTETGITRVLSLRHEFPNVWSKLQEAPARATFELDAVHVPFFMPASGLEPTAIEVLVGKRAGGYPKVRFDGFPAAPDPNAVPGAPAPPPDGAGADPQTGLWRILKTPATSAFVGPHTIAVEWDAAAPKPDDILLRAVLKATAGP